MMEPTPLRPDDQVAGGFIAMRLGGQTFELSVLPMRTNRDFLRKLDEAVKSLRGDAEALDTFDGVVDFLVGQAEAMMDLLIAYDQLGAKVLPDRDWIDSNATDGECYEAFKRVTAAASPLAEEALRIAPQLIPAVIDAVRRGVERGVARGMTSMAIRKASSGSPRTTAGAPTTSSPTSPTSSSTSTSKRAPAAATKKRGRNRNASSTA